jgi:hypothetical protein
MTNKVYDISGLTLLHLGAQRLNLRPHSKTLEYEAGVFAPDKKIIVLGQLAPALFLQSLLTLELANADTTK